MWNIFKYVKLKFFGLDQTNENSKQLMKQSFQKLSINVFINNPSTDPLIHYMCPYLYRNIFEVS